MRINLVSEPSVELVEGQAINKKQVTVQYRYYQAVLVLLDLILIFLAFRASYIVRFESGIPYFRGSIIPGDAFYSQFMLLTIPFWLIIFAFTGLYHIPNLLGGTREYAKLFNACTLGMFLVISIGFLFPDELFLARGWVILSWLFGFMFTAVGRFLMRRIIYSLRMKGYFQSPAIIVGANEEGRLLIQQFKHWQTSGIRLVGYVAEQPITDENLDLKYLGSLSDLRQIVNRFNITEMILVSSALNQDQILSLFRQYGTTKDINLRLSSGLYEVITTGMEVREEGFVPLLTINKVRMTGMDQALKLLMDYMITIPLLVILAPLFAIIALLVRLDSPGPVFYRRRVMGVNGREFDAFKFRTMRVDGDDILEANPELKKEYLENFKIKDDPRVTRIGKFLRKTSIDELPQLINVLRNEMSLVGPRMICPDELSKYNQWDINLMTVKPGITGLWQVRGRSDVSYEERVRMDMFYVRNWTIWLDLQLLFQTIPAVLSRRGAY